MKRAKSQGLNMAIQADGKVSDFVLSGDLSKEQRAKVLFAAWKQVTQQLIADDSDLLAFMREVGSSSTKSPLKYTIVPDRVTDGSREKTGLLDLS